MKLQDLQEERNIAQRNVRRNTTECSCTLPRKAYIRCLTMTNMLCNICLATENVSEKVDRLDLCKPCYEAVKKEVDRQKKRDGIDG